MMNDFEDVIVLPSGAAVLRCFWDSIAELQAAGSRVSVQDDEVRITPTDARYEDLSECMSRRASEIEAILALEQVPSA